MKEITDAQAMTQAALLLQQHGHCKQALIIESESMLSSYHGPNARVGSMCIAGALNTATLGSPHWDRSSQTIRCLNKIAVVIGVKGNSAVISWNNALARTSEEVIDALIKTAAREEGNADSV